MQFSKEKVKSIFDKAIEKTVLYTKKVCYLMRHSRLALFSVALVLGLIATLLFSGITIAYEVECNGTVVAQIKNKSDYDKAVNVAQDMLTTCKIGDYAEAPSFRLTVTTERKLTDLNKMAINIIEGTKQLALGSALKIDGEIVGCVCVEDNLQDSVDSYLENYYKGEEVVSTFVKNVEVVDGYYPITSFENINTVKEMLKSLDVKTVQTLRCRKEIAYTSVTRKSDSRVLGDVYKAVVGVNGICETVEEIELLNGKVVSTVKMFENVVKQPVQEVVVVGTKRDTSVSNVYISELGCIWPLKRVSGQIITAYYGDGRNHKGIDIASPSGTPIYAAQGGTVVTSEYGGGYGHYVVIDHGNGYKTLYAHASKRLVSVGEKVSQGQVIALVGTTGISTGNHLHFEVQKDGVKLNPAPFIGL